MVELYDHQKEASGKLSNGKILVGGVGTGKSITALDYYVANESPRPIFVITTARKRDEMDWEREAALFSISTNPELGAHGTLKVDSWNNIKKYVDQEEAFFIFDEQRLVGSGAWVKAFYKIARRNRWIILSGTPGDNWIDYIAVFVANGFYKNQTQFKNRHVVYSYYGRYPKIERYLETDLLEANRKKVIVEMPFVRHTTRHLHEVEVGYDRAIFKQVMKTRQDPETGEPFMDASGLLHGLRKVGNSDRSRVETIGKILKDHPRLIIFYNFDYELDILREYFSWQTRKPVNTESSNSFSIESTASRAGVESTTNKSPSTTTQLSTDTSSKPIVAEWNGHKHEPLPEGESWVYLVQYVAGAEAWNCTTTDAMVFYSLTYSYKNFEQAQGRIDRLNTKYFNLHYYILKNTGAIDRAIWQALKNKKNFNERAFTKGM